MYNLEHFAKQGTPVSGPARTKAVKYGFKEADIEQLGKLINQSLNERLTEMATGLQEDLHRILGDVRAEPGEKTFNFFGDKLDFSTDFLTRFYEESKQNGNNS